MPSKATTSEDIPNKTTEILLLTFNIIVKSWNDYILIQKNLQSQSIAPVKVYQNQIARKAPVIARSL